MKPEAERIRIRYLYRRKILNGEITLQRHTAKRLIGPDCAYHLYGVKGKSEAQAAKARGGKRQKAKGPK